MTDISNFRIEISAAFKYSMVTMKKILLHTCCACCATHSINALRDEGYEVVTFFYNPNIHPAEEYTARLADMKRLAEETGIENIEPAPYDDKIWFELTKGLEKEPEGGRRCEICFEMRLEKTAEYAREPGIETFATTLTISPHKDAGLINKLGRKAAEKYGVEYYGSNFKKKNGFKKSIELSRKHGLYRQNYCGCIYSQSRK